MGSGAVGSPTMTETLAIASSAFARPDSAFRVRANMWIGDELLRRDSTTAPPCLPVAPSTRYFWAAMLSYASSFCGLEGLFWGGCMDADQSVSFLLLLVGREG